MASILVVDDDEHIRALIKNILEVMTQLLSDQLNKPSISAGSSA
jgi:CheY-like chemotaxis protein